MADAARDLIEIQIPAILDVPPWPMPARHLAAARMAAAKELKTLAVVPAADAVQALPKQLPYVVPLLGRNDDRKQQGHH